MTKCNQENLACAHPASFAADEAVDRRRAPRLAVYLRSTIYPIDVFCDARIYDASATGVMGQAAIELAIGQKVHITTDDQLFTTGTVKWVRDQQFGLSVPDALNMFGIEAIDNDNSHSEGHHPRAQRIKIDATARILVGRPPRPAIVRNLSPTGMLIDIGPGLRPGQHIIVNAVNSSPIYGRIQWIDGGRVGFKAYSLISKLPVTCRNL